MKREVEKQEAETAKVIKQANAELERVRQETDARKHAANTELERVRQETFLEVARKQSEVAMHRQTVEELHHQISGLAKRIPPIFNADAGK